MTSPLPPADPAKNRRLIAERLGWPDTALATCIEIENEFPGWMVYWTQGGLPRDRDPGFRAFIQVHGWRRTDVAGATAEELRERLADAVTKLPDRAW